mgnify:CR=1 FL=1
MTKYAIYTKWHWQNGLGSSEEIQNGMKENLQGKTDAIDVKKDVELLVSQIDRCSEILKKLTLNPIVEDNFIDSNLTLSKYIDEIYFNSDCRKMSNYASKLGARVEFLRPSYLAQSNTSSAEVLIHHIKKTDLQSKFDYLILLEPTSPLTNENDIDKALKKLIDKKIN